MEEFAHILIHALKDTAILLPILFVVYLLIEFLEYKNVFKFEKSKLLNGKASPLIGSAFGSLPQCGFSVVSAELFSERKISIGALIAVFIATSDEAIPIMLSNYKAIPTLICLLFVKIIFAILVGYLTMFIYGRIFKNKTHSSHAKPHDEHEHLHACCHHDLQDEKFDWKHPIIHCLKIAFYIFIINLIFESIVTLVGQANLLAFLNSSKIFQPLFAVLVGFIPNCVSSVIITELYLMGGLSFGSIVAGLSVNAGIGLVVLLKENKNHKENLFIILSLLISSLIIGYGLHFLPITLI